MTYNIDAKKLSELLTTQDIVKVLESLGARQYNNSNPKFLLWSSICHHRNIEGHKPKLYLNTTTHYMNCFSCGEGFNIYELVMKRKQLLGEKCNFPQSLQYVCDICGIEYDKTNVEVEKSDTLCDWQSCVNRYLRNESVVSENTIYDKSKFFQVLDDIYYQEWIDEGISIETMQKYNVKFYKREQQVVVPIYDEHNNLVGSHCRNLNPELVDNGLKYYHLCTLDGTEYKFPMSNVLYGLNINKGNIEYTKSVILFEGLKSVLKMDNILEYNNSTAIFGLNFQKAKRDILIKLGITNVVIALDKQYHKMYDDNGEKTDEFVLYEKKVMKIVDMMSPYVETIDVVYDTDESNLLDYKDSPCDKGEDVWWKLWNSKERVYGN